MKRLLYLAVAAVLFFASCAENEEVVQSNILPSGDFVAMFDEATRTELDGSSVVWHENDQLTIFTNTSHNRQYKIKTLTEDGRTATFGYVGYTGSDNTMIETNYAVYPYNADATLSNGVVTTVLEASQSYNTTNGGLCYALMSAASEDNNFAFVNSGALMRFKVSNILPDEFTLNSIHLTSANHKLAGEVTINLNGDKMAVVTENGVNSITLADINCKVTAEVQEFYVALPATTFDENDLVVVFEFAEGNKEFTLPAFELKQGKIKTISYSIADAEDFTGSTPGEEPKPANNEIWYTSEYDVTLEFDENDFDANIVSHTYVGGKHVITFDADLTTIGEDAFSHTQLESIYIPDSVTAIDDTAFYYCLCLHEFKGKFAEDNGKALVVNGRLVACARSIPSDYIIPETVTSISNRAFHYFGHVGSLTIPNSVETIEEDSFYGCGALKEFKGKFAEDNGRALVFNNVLIAAALNGLTEYTIPDNITKVGSRAFIHEEELQNLVIGSNVTEISRDLCAIPDIRVCNSVTLQGDAKTIVGLGNLNFVSEFRGDYAQDNGRAWVIDGELYGFASDGLTEYTIPSGVVSIHEQAFYGCQELESVTIPDSVTSIGREAFIYCYGLKSVTIGEGIKAIGGYAFLHCSDLIDVYCRAATPPTLGLGAFYIEEPREGDLAIYVPTTSVDAYKESWSEYANAIVGYDFERDEIDDSATPPTEVKFVLPPSNEIWYTSTTGEVIELSRYPYELESNIYENGIGKYIFAEDVIDISNCFGSNSSSMEVLAQFTSIILPPTITEIDCYAALFGLKNVHTLVLPVNLESLGTDVIGALGENLEETHLYFLSENCPNVSNWRVFWNLESHMCAHYPVGSDYSSIAHALEYWKATYQPDFTYEMVETVYELVYSN